MERGAVGVGYRPAVMEGYCWWTCSAQLWCNGPGREGNWGGLAGQVSWGSWSRVKNSSLMERIRTTS